MGSNFAAGDVAKIVEAITGLTWCALAALVLLRLLPAVKEALAKRKVSVKVAGMELSFQEAADQVEKQLEAIRSLGEQVDQLGSRLAAIEGRPSTRLTSQRPAPAKRQTHQILWVDDTPQNNAYEISALEGDGVRTILARSTDEAMRALDRTSFSVVVTDMTREENGERITDAGAQLIRRMRAEKIRTPVVVYTTRRKAEDWEDELRPQEVPVAWSQLDLLTLVARLLREAETSSAT
jgi:CheY-like chemotaxis protein